MIDRLDNGRQDERQAFADRARIAGEIDDERAAARAGGGAGEDRGLYLLERGHAHDFAEARQLTLEHRARRLRRNVARRGTGAAGCDDEPVRLLAQPAEERLQRRLLVRHKDARPFDRVREVLGEEALDRRAAAVFIHARRRAVAEGDAREFHCFIFSVTRMPPMTISLSTALHMS